MADDTQVSSDNILSEVLNENKGLSKVYHPNNTAIIFADSKRLGANKRSGGGDRQLEWWPPTEEGAPNFPRPLGYKGKTVLEIYRQDLKSNPKALKKAVYGDLLHGMEADPYYASLKKQFIENYPLKISEFNKKLLAKGQSQKSIDDMYIRGWLSPDERDEFRKAQASGEQRYSPKQLEILKKMQGYLATGQSMNGDSKSVASSASLKWFKMQAPDGKWYKTQADSVENAKAKILKSAGAASKAVDVTGKPTTNKDPWGGTDPTSRLGRELVLGAFSGMGVAETQTPLKDTAKGLAEIFKPPTGVKGAAEVAIGGPTIPAYRMAKGMVTGTYQGGEDIYKGALRGFEGDPAGWERAAHGTGQILGTLAALGLGGGTDELASPKTIKILREHAAELDSRALKVAKGTSTATGLQVAQEGIWGAIKNLPDMIEKARKTKYAQVEKLAQEETQKSGPIHDVESDIAPIEQEWKKVANARANLSPQVMLKVNNFLKLLRSQLDPQTGKFVPRDLSKLTMTDMVELTRHDGLLSRLSKFDKEHPVPEQVMNMARRVSQAFNDKIAQASPEISKLRAEQSRLIEARDQATYNVEAMLNDKTSAAKSIFRMGGGAIGAYVGLKLLGIPYAEAFAVPLLLWNGLKSTPFRTLKAAVYARAADMLEGTVRGTYKPPSRRVTRPPQAGGTPPAAPTGGGGGPTTPVQPASGPSGLTAPSAPLGAVSGVPKALSGQVLAGPPNVPNAASLRLGAGTPPSPEVAAQIAKTWEAKAATDKTLATLPEAKAASDVWTEADDIKARQTKEPPKAKLTEGSAVPARTKQNLLNEIDAQVGRLDSSNAGVAKRARTTLDQVKTLLDDKKVAGLSEEERTKLIQRADWRARQAKVRANKPAESVAAREPSAEQAGGTGEGVKRSTEDLASATGSAEDFAIAKQQAYEALARFPGGVEWADNLKKAAKELEAGAKEKGVAYDPNSEFDAVLEAIKLMREQGMDMGPEKPPKGGGGVPPRRTGGASVPTTASERSPISESRISPRRGDYPTQGIGPSPGPGVSAEKVAGGNIKMGADTERLARILGSSLYKERGPGVVVKELLQNAYDATRGLPKGEGKVNVLFDEKDNSLQVRDNGPGMTPDEVYTVFTDLGSSGKGGQAEASGGFGLAKAAPFMIADKLEVATVARGADGQRVRTTFTSTPEDIISGKVTPKITKIAEKTEFGTPIDAPTGTVIKAYFDKKQSLYSAQEFARNAKRSTRAPAELTVHRQYRSSDKPEVLSTDLAPVDTHVASVNVPDSAQLEVFKSSQKEPLSKAMGNLPIEIQNNGIFQFTKTHWLGDAAKLRGMPSRIVVDVKALVNEGHENYPFSANREQLRSLVDDKVDNIVNEHFVKPALDKMKAEIAKIYNTLPTIKFSRPNAEAASAPILDAGSRLTPEEVTELQGNPALKGIVRALHESAYNTINKMKSTPFGRWLDNPDLTLGAGIERVGIVLSDKVHGVHVMSPEIDPSTSVSMGGGRRATMFVNPFSFDKLAASSDAVASLMFHTIKHELIHDVIRGHNESFTSAEAKVSHFLGMNHEIAELLKLRDAYEQARSGKNAAHFDRALQIYEESRKRDEVTPDILGGEELRSKKPTP